MIADPQPSPQLEVFPWGADLAPPVHGPADSSQRRVFPPDTLGVHAHSPLAASFMSTAPVIDGRLDDWRLVRWYDLAGAGTVFRGPWTGPWDLALRFALVWTPDGLVLGGRLADDLPTGDVGPQRAVERVTLAIASSDPVVSRYWMGGSRRFRIGRDGRFDAWTDLRSRRPEPFDAAALGVRVSLNTVAETGDAPGPMEFELFVPWTALFPLLPVPGDLPLVNIIIEDVDGDVEKAAAWTTRRERDAIRPGWVALECAGGATVPNWIVSTSTLAPEPWCEWSLALLGSPVRSRARTLELRAEGIPEVARTLRTAVPPGDRFLVRLGPLGPSHSAWPSERAARLELELPGQKQRLAWDVSRPVDEATLRRAADAAIASIPVAAPATFPSITDVAVRLERARQEIESMGTWFERRFHATGILAWRAASRARVERLLGDAEVLHRAVAAASERDGILARRWPQRGLGGLPTNEIFLRGYRSEIDGSVQPYRVFVPDKTGPHPPLVVALHDLDQDESTLLESTTLARRCRERGWVVLCPFGRGNSGYLATGERDVIETLAATREALPVDGRRLYITGLGMGGTGTWLLPLRHPDLFAAAAEVSGYGDFDQPGLVELLGFRPAEEAWCEAHNPMRLVRRDMTTAFRIAHGERDAIVSPVHARVLHARLRELGVAHEYRLDPAGDHGLRFFDDELQASLEFFGRHARPTDGVANPAAFTGVGPPLVDVFARGPFAIVWGASKLGPGAGDLEESSAEEKVSAGLPDNLATALQLAAEWKSKHAGAATVLPDTSVTEEMMRTTNLVLVGDPETNALIARWKERLPVRYEWGLLVLGGTGYPQAKYGLVAAAANPEFRERTLVLVSGMKDRLSLLPRSAFSIAAAYAIVSPAQGVVDIGNESSER